VADETNITPETILITDEVMKTITDITKMPMLKLLLTKILPEQRKNIVGIEIKGDIIIQYRQDEQVVTKTIPTEQGNKLINAIMQTIIS
jgi:fructose-bisphosphate aldolase class 1